MPAAWPPGRPPRCTCSPTTSARRSSAAWLVTPGRSMPGLRSRCWRWRSSPSAGCAPRGCGTPRRWTPRGADPVTRLGTPGRGHAPGRAPAPRSGFGAPTNAHGGVRSALRALSRRSPVAVQSDVDVDGRLPEPVELAAYYTVAEALTKAAKHAHASVVDVCTAAGEGARRIEVRDDGRGGANPARDADG